MHWLDILDYPDDFHVWKPTGAPWVGEIERAGHSYGANFKTTPCDRTELVNKCMKDHVGNSLKIHSVNYITKVIYLELAGYSRFS